MALLMPLSKMTQKVSLLSLFPANLRIIGEDAAMDICPTYFLYISYCFYTVKKEKKIFLKYKEIWIGCKVKYD
jgi:hypothetical protein